MVDLEENHAFVEIFVHEPGRKLLIAATSGHGFVVPEDEMVAMTRKGKQVMNLTEPEEARLCAPVDGDTVAAIGENRKMLIFPLEEVNEMARGKGVRLQRYKDGNAARVRALLPVSGSARSRFVMRTGDERHEKVARNDCTFADTGGRGVAAERRPNPDEENGATGPKGPATSTHLRPSSPSVLAGRPTATATTGMTRR